MNILEIADLGKGTGQVSWQRGQGIRRQCSVPFADPLTPQDRADLRWYLEQYLQFPYGAEEWKAKQVEQRMDAWGQALFEQVFPRLKADPDPRSLYQEAVREGLANCELCITSENTDFLNIPWELIRDPVPGRGYLAPLLGGFYRYRTGHSLGVPPAVPTEGPFRILLVIARPYGEGDVPFGTVARPLLEALRPLRGRIELEVCRPPTFDELQRRLNAHKGHYHLVHFDGHGVFAPGSGGPLQYGVAAEQGHLVFEKVDGTEHVVNSRDLGQALAACGVPLFVLNACQSAEEGSRDAYSSVAAQLVASGAQGVVAMSYSVYATTAARFMERFYERLVAGSSLAAAVAAARLRLHAQPQHETSRGALEIRDWMVPVLYQQQHGFVPIPQSPGAAAVQEAAEPSLLQRAAEACPEGRFGFVGRDYDMLSIERALRDDRAPWALLTGMGGVGKTELARGFARWFAETGGCPGGVFATSFRHNAAFGQVVGSTVGFATDFSRRSEEKQWRVLTSYLQEHACLLVWDNFEVVNGYPEGAEPLAPPQERDRLARFLKALRGGKSRVLITTRKLEEGWLKIDYGLVELRGLSPSDAMLLANRILRTVGRKPEEFGEDYHKLLNLLRGHPLSLTVVLPRLRTESPAQAIGAIQHGLESLGDPLEASLGYAFSGMSPQAHQHLPFLALFATYVHADTLGAFVGAGDEQQRVYEAVMGGALDAAGWQAVLDEAARDGLLRPLGSRIYEMHPTLPPFLRRHLARAAGDEGLRRLDREFMRFYAAWGAHYLEGMRKADPNALAAATVEEANLLRALRLAERAERWAEAQAMAQTLGELYEARGRSAEWASLRSHLLRRVGRQMAPGAERDRADLWMYLLHDEANDALRRNELDAAEAAYQAVAEYLTSLADAAVEPKIAVAYHQLGMVAQERQRLDEAEAWYKKALGVFERLGLERYAADEYHQLGRVAQERQRLDEAEAWYRKALGVFERLGRPPLRVNTLAQLGVLRRAQARPGEAVAWLARAWAIAAEYKMAVAAQVLLVLGLLLESMGEEAFTAAWGQATGGQPLPLAAIRQALAQANKK